MQSIISQRVPQVRRDEKSASAVASCRKVSSRNKRAISLRPSILPFPHRCPFDRIRTVHGTRVSKVNPFYVRLHGTRYRHLMNQKEVVALGRIHALIKRTFCRRRRRRRSWTYRNIDRKHFARTSFMRKHKLNNKIIFSTDADGISDNDIYPNCFALLGQCVFKNVFIMSRW